MEASVHKLRCLNQLRSKDKNIEKYIYLSQLKDADTNMFYNLCLEHMSVSAGSLYLGHSVLNIAQEMTPLIYTPTVGDACLQYSHIFRRPDGLVCGFMLRPHQAI